MDNYPGYVVPILVDWGLANFFHEGPHSKHFRFCDPLGPISAEDTQLLSCCSEKAAMCISKQVCVALVGPFLAEL